MITICFSSICLPDFLSFRLNSLHDRIIGKHANGALPILLRRLLPQTQEERGDLLFKHCDAFLKCCFHRAFGLLYVLDRTVLSSRRWKNIGVKIEVPFLLSTYQGKSVL